MRHRIARLALAGTLVLTGAAGFACDDKGNDDDLEVEGNLDGELEGEGEGEGGDD